MEKLGCGEWGGGRVFESWNSFDANLKRFGGNGDGRKHQETEKKESSSIFSRVTYSVFLAAECNLILM